MGEGASSPVALEFALQANTKASPRPQQPPLDHLIAAQFTSSKRARVAVDASDTQPAPSAHRAISKNAGRVGVSGLPKLAQVSRSAASPPPAALEPFSRASLRYASGCP
jgi:hypothetical protein